MRTNKVSLMKKIKEESDNFNKWKKERQTEVLTLRKQILKKDRENDALKREFQKKDLVAKRKQEEVYALQNR